MSPVSDVFRRLLRGPFVLILLLLSAMSTRSAPPDAPRPLPPATAEKLPRWRGFNLLEKFQLSDRRRPFVEQDFALISRLGFNFVRLPMDYRLWIKDGDWEWFDEATLREIDQAVGWGERYGLHVCINFHRAPGYTVAQPPERTSVWTDPEAQRVCALHWATFARRHKGVPANRLSFNLFNEPAGVKPEEYVRVVRGIVEAIRREDPDRLVICDGLEWARVPVPELRGLRVAQATRGYDPIELTHYKAHWMASEDFPYPQWPAPQPASGMLLGPNRRGGASGLVIDGPFAGATDLRLHVYQVSVAADLVVEADGRRVYEKAFKCGPGQGEWKEVQYSEQHGIYQNVYDKDYAARIPAGTKQVRIHITGGDWLHLSQLGLTPGGAAREDVLNLDNAWGNRAAPFRYAPGDEAGPFIGRFVRDRQWLRDNHVRPWEGLGSQGVGVFVGEWGTYNKTPHDVVLRWAEDCLANWKEADMGWALWNFRGPFGVLDSGRADVRYEDFEGHKVDRRFLELLQRY